MGKLFVLSGPSGVGKTTFLTALFQERPTDLVLIPRYTDRPKRSGEDEGFEHYFVSHGELLQKVFANDFIHIEKWGDYYSAIESRSVEEVLNSESDGLVLTSVFGASRLRATYGLRVTCLYLWTYDRTSLLSPRCLEDQSDQVLELKWRIRKKLVEDGFSEYETASLSGDEFLKKRMVDNYLDIASVNGRLRAGEDVKVLPNPRDEMSKATQSFAKLREAPKVFGHDANKVRGGGCFVLMPFKPEMKPIYDDHIKKVCERIGVSVTRADQIFSHRAVMEDVREAVVTARYIIADLTDNNPNVFYELGICHAIGKNVILITQNEDVPFDVRHIRHIRYQYTPRGMLEFEEILASTIGALQAT